MTMADIPKEAMEKHQARPERRAQIPKKLGRYRILHEVGRGATAYVYKAYDPQLDRFLAIKVLRQELAQDDDYREAFLKEARLAAQLTHPGIVTIYDVGIADAKPYIAMELLEGATLEEILKTQGKLNLRTAIAMSSQLSRALNYAHKQGVVHRDIKPGNIVVLKDKKTVKLTDFGIAQLDETLGSAGKHTDKVLGTPEYMSPEQVLGKNVDNRSDIYSFGVLIFRMLMGITPFKGTDLGQLFKQIVKDKPPAIKVEEEKVQDDVQDLIRKMLQKNPNKRFQKSAMITAELNNIQQRLGVAKKSQSGKQFVSLRLRWTATMAGIVFVAMCISLAVVYFVQYRALSGITFDYGRSIARMLAFESSAPILLDDTVGLNALIQESSKNEQLTSVDVMQPDGNILASTDASKVGQLFAPPQERELMHSMEDAQIFKREIADKQILFDIEMPVMYSNKQLGYIYVTFNADSMYGASKTTLITMLSVMMITLFVVFAITLVIAKQTSADFRRVTQAINKIAFGRIDARLISQRNDEVGELFAAFNRMASSLEGRLEPEKKVKPDEKLELSIKPTSAKREVMMETIELNIENKKES